MDTFHICLGAFFVFEAFVMLIVFVQQLHMLYTIISYANYRSLSFHYFFSNLLSQVLNYANPASLESGIWCVNSASQMITVTQSLEYVKVLIRTQTT